MSVLGAMLKSWRLEGFRKCKEWVKKFLNNPNKLFIVNVKGGKDPTISAFLL